MVVKNDLLVAGAVSLSSWVMVCDILSPPADDVLNIRSFYFLSRAIIALLVAIPGLIDVVGLFRFI